LSATIPFRPAITFLRLPSQTCIRTASIDVLRLAETCKSDPERTNRQSRVSMTGTLLTQLRDGTRRTAGGRGSKETCD